MSTKAAVRVDVRPLEGLADRMERAAVRGRYAVEAAAAVNVVAVRADESLRAGQIRDINLTPTYVKSKTDLQLAVGSGPAKATITTKGDPTIMGQFSPLQMLPGNGVMRRAGPRTGMRNAGTAVAIKRSQAIFEPQWFVLPLRRGAIAGANGFGVFVRDDRLPPSSKAAREGRAGKRHVYGPSPYQLFREQIRVQEGDIQADLQATALERLGEALRGDLT